MSSHYKGEVSLSNYLSIYLSLHPLYSIIYPPIYPFIYLLIYPPIYPSIYLSIHLSIYLSINLSVQQSFYLLQASVIYPLFGQQAIILTVQPNSALHSLLLFICSNIHSFVQLILLFVMRKEEKKSGISIHHLFFRSKTLNSLLFLIIIFSFDKFVCVLRI